MTWPSELEVCLSYLSSSESVAQWLCAWLLWQSRRTCAGERRGPGEPPTKLGGAGQADGCGPARRVVR